MAQPGSPDPIDVLAELGFGRSGARLYADELRGPLTDGVVRLLPGVTGTRAGSVVTALVAAALRTVPATVARLDPQLERFETSAVLPALWLMVIGRELDARAGRSPGRGAAPAPSATLGEVRESLRSTGDDVLGRYLGTQSLPFARLATAARVTAPEAGAWGGWATYAALGMIATSEVLPRPGRRRLRLPWNRRGAQDAGAAYVLGTAMVAATAEELIRGRDRPPG